MPDPTLTPNELYVLALHRKGLLAYVAPSDEWLDGADELPENLQATAESLTRRGHLPDFAQWFPS